MATSLPKYNKALADALPTFKLFVELSRRNTRVPLRAFAEPVRWVLLPIRALVSSVFIGFLLLRLWGYFFFLPPLPDWAPSQPLWPV